MSSFIDSDIKFVDKVIDNGINYLLSQNNEGRWRGFPTLAGTSDVWVTGFVLTHIGELMKQQEIITESQKFLLKSRKASGAWSYSIAVPPDADSTAWCLLALQSYTELKDAELDKSKKCLWNHLKDQGIATYTSDSGIQEFISAPSKEVIAGWTSAHPDVSAAAVLADIKSEKAPAVLKWLIEKQHEGLIDSYWWRVPYYTTSLLLRAFSRLDKVLPKNLANKIYKEIVDRQLPNGSFALDSSNEPDAFTTAMALESLIYLSYSGTNQAIEKCIRALLESQQPNGAWEGGLILRIPAPNIMNPEIVDSWSTVNGGGNSYVEDQNGIFATTMACYALDYWRRTKSEQYKSTHVKSSIV